MMDADGPGAIVRIWSADPRGTLRFYIDGDPKPAIEAPMQDVLGGKFPGWPTPIAGMRARGWNLYFPIAYAKHCTVTCDTGGFYYHVNYRTYEKGADVKSFAPEDLTRLSAKIGDVAKKLENPRSAARLPSGTTSVETATDLAPGGESKSKFFELTDGPKAIVGLLVTTEAKNLERALRAVVLLMTFDGEKTVECPLGDFFATAPGLNRYASLPVGVSEIDGKLRLWSHWWMPFARTAKIALRNLGEEAMHVHFRIALAPYAWDDSSLLFHAGWRIERDIPSRPFVDWTHLDVKGKGRFVGGALHIINPVKNWWGEGDEKRGLLRLRVEQSGAVYARLPQPASMRRARHLRQQSGEPVPRPRRHPLHPVVQVRHGKLAPSRGREDDTRGGELLVRAAGRHVRVPAADEG